MVGIVHPESLATKSLPCVLSTTVPTSGLTYLFLACRLFELYGGESNAKLLAKELPLLRDIGPQKCLTFSVDGSKLATGGEVSNIS